MRKNPNSSKTLAARIIHAFDTGRIKHMDEEGRLITTECFFPGIRQEVAEKIGVKPNPGFDAVFNCLMWYQAGNGQLIPYL